MQSILVTGSEGMCGKTDFEFQDSLDAVEAAGNRKRYSSSHSKRDLQNWARLRVAYDNLTNSNSGEDVEEAASDRVELHLSENFFTFLYNFHLGGSLYFRQKI